MEGISRHLLDNEQWVGDSVGAAHRWPSPVPHLSMVILCTRFCALTGTMPALGSVEHLKLRFRTTMTLLPAAQNARAVSSSSICGNFGYFMV